MPTRDQSADRFDFAPTANWKMIRARAKLLSDLRAYFDRLGILEVETPLISSDTVVDRYLDPIEVRDPLCRSETVNDASSTGSGRLESIGNDWHGNENHGNDHPKHRYWLQTSPEFAMKRLLSSFRNPEFPEGIFQICKAFRCEELGDLHNPEFTMIEWYRVGDGYEEGRRFLRELADHFLVATKPGRSECGEITYRDAMREFADIDPFFDSIERLRERGTESENLGFAYEDVDRDFWLNMIFESQVQPRLGELGPVVVFDYPASQSALARTRQVNSEDQHQYLVAERFELFFSGIELANGYHELIDAKKLGERNAAVNQQRRTDRKEELPENSRLIKAMESGLPPCAGVALGFDRLLMCIYGCESIEEVVAFPFERA